MVIGYINDMTVKAVKIVLEKYPKGLWTPKSVILSKYNPEPHYIQSFRIKKWFLQKKKLIKYVELGRWL